MLKNYRTFYEAGEEIPVYNDVKDVPAKVAGSQKWVDPQKAEELVKFGIAEEVAEKSTKKKRTTKKKNADK